MHVSCLLVKSFNRQTACIHVRKELVWYLPNPNSYINAGLSHSYPAYVQHTIPYPMRDIISVTYLVNFNIYFVFCPITVTYFILTFILVYLKNIHINNYAFWRNVIKRNSQKYDSYIQTYIMLCSYILQPWPILK